jgi:Putative prokaryotic signal transducing protein
MVDEMKVIKVFSNETEAVIAKGLLESEGITALIRKDDVGGMLPSLQQTIGVKLLVNRDDVDKAMNILEEI